MSAIIDRARQDLAEAEGRLLTAQADVEELRAFVNRLERYEAEARTGMRHAINGAIAGSRVVGGLSAAGKTVLESLEMVLGATPQPLLLDEILAKMTQVGKPIGGVDPKANLSSVLSRNPQFHYEKGRGWSLVHDAQAAAQ